MALEEKRNICTQFSIYLYYLVVCYNFFVYYLRLCKNRKEEHTMLNQFSRTELLIGEEGLNKLQNAKVAIFGIGGVGSFVAEGLIRCRSWKLYISR